MSIWRVSQYTESVQGKIFTGKVIEGAHRGMALGFPTANIALSDESLTGVYAGLVTIEGSVYMAALFADQKRNLLEAHVLDFSGDLYGKEITIEIIKKIRDRQVFTDSALLKEAIQRDVQTTRDVLSS